MLSLQFFDILLVAASLVGVATAQDSSAPGFHADPPGNVTWFEPIRLADVVNVGNMGKEP